MRSARVFRLFLAVVQWRAPHLDASLSASCTGVSTLRRFVSRMQPVVMESSGTKSRRSFGARLRTVHHHLVQDEVRLSYGASRQPARERAATSHLVEVEHDVQLAHGAEVAVQRLHVRVHQLQHDERVFVAVNASKHEERRVPPVHHLCRGRNSPRLQVSGADGLQRAHTPYSCGARRWSTACRCARGTGARFRLPRRDAPPRARAAQRELGAGCMWPDQPAACLVILRQARLALLVDQQQEATCTLQREKALRRVDWGRAPYCHRTTKRRRP